MLLILRLSKSKRKIPEVNVHLQTVVQRTAYAVYMLNVIKAVALNDDGELKNFQSASGWKITTAHASICNHCHALPLGVHLVGNGTNIHRGNSASRRCAKCLLPEDLR